MHRLLAPSHSAGGQAPPQVTTDSHLHKYIFIENKKAWCFLPCKRHLAHPRCLSWHCTTSQHRVDIRGSVVDRRALTCVLVLRVRTGNEAVFRALLAANEEGRSQGIYIHALDIAHYLGC